MSVKNKKRHYVKWTEEETNFLKENYSTADSKTIASVLGKSRDCIYVKASALGLKRPNAEEQRKKAERIKRCKANSNAPRWTAEEIQFLKDNEGKMTLKEIAEKLGKSYSAASCKRMSLKRVKTLRVVPTVNVDEAAPVENHFKAWSKEDEKYLKDNYGSIPVSVMAKKLGRTEDAVKGRAYVFGLVDEKTTTRAKWTKEEIVFLKKNVNKKTNEEMAQYLGRSIASVAGKLSELKLKKAFPLRKGTKGNWFVKSFIAASVVANIGLVTYILLTLVK